MGMKMAAAFQLLLPAYVACERARPRRSELVEQQAFMGFASPFLARIAERPRWLNRTLSAAVYGLDRALVRIGVLEAEYYFLVYQNLVICDRDDRRT